MVCLGDLRSTHTARDAYGGFLSSRGRDVSEDPVGHLCALVPTRFVPETEMDAVIDADIDHIGSHVREPIVGAALLSGLRVVASNCEGDIILPEEQRECAGQRCRNVVGT